MATMWGLKVVAVVPMAWGTNHSKPGEVVVGPRVVWVSWGMVVQEEWFL